MEIKKVSIIGLGALGILFGHPLAKRMPKGDLRIIADQEITSETIIGQTYALGDACLWRTGTILDLLNPEGKPSMRQIWKLNALVRWNYFRVRYWSLGKNTVF